MLKNGSVSRLVGLLILSVVSGFLFGCESDSVMAVLDLDPKVGHTQGDQPVRIIGKNFRQDIGYSVYFGSDKAVSVTILSPEVILVTTPARSEKGAVDVTIRSDDGLAFRIPKGFEFKEMSGSVIGGIGETGTVADEEKGNLPY